MQKHPVTAVVLARNEEVRLKKLLPTLSFCQQIVVVNNTSTDKTEEVAVSLGATVINQAGTDFSILRNSGLKQVETPWALFIDADETLSGDTKNEIIQIVNNPEIKTVGYRIRRINYFLGRKMKYGDMAHDWLVRLARKDAGTWRRGVHEVWAVKGEVGQLKNPLEHHTADDLTDYLEKIIFWAKLHAQANLAEGKKASFWKVLLYPKAKFIKSYLIQQGWRDGVHGLVYAMIMAWHSFLAWGDAWVLQKKSAKG